jgi:predicted oxidoreductase
MTIARKAATSIGSFSCDSLIPAFLDAACTEKDAFARIRNMQWVHADAGVIFGAMRLAGTWNPAEIDDAKRTRAFAALDAAYAAGIQVFDHADIYARGGCETLHGEYLRMHPARRTETILLNKCGIRHDPHRYDFSREHILESVEAARERMGVDSFDLWQLHRPDYLMDPRDVAFAFDELADRGWVSEFAVSNFRPSQVRALEQSLSAPLVAHQFEFSLLHLQPLEDGTLDQCLEMRIAPLIWGPLAGGRLGQLATDHPLRVELARVAESEGISEAAAAIAWVRTHPARPIPIFGTMTPERIGEFASERDRTLNREDWYRLLVAARGENLP